MSRLKTTITHRKISRELYESKGKCGTQWTQAWINEWEGNSCANTMTNQCNLDVRLIKHWCN